MKGLPNYLTFLRLLLIPFFVLLMIDPSPAMLNFAIAIFIFAALTDYFDGILARRYGAVSDFGKLLDPIADKLLVMAALVMLVGQRGDLDGKPWVPAWMVVLVLAREIWVGGLRAVAASHGTLIAAGNAGKMKSLVQMIAIVCILLHDSKFYLFSEVVTFQWLGLYLLLISIVFSYWGAAQYSITTLAPLLCLKESAAPSSSEALKSKSLVKSESDSKERSLEGTGPH